MFISEPHAGHVYTAERSPKGYHKFIWSVTPVKMPVPKRVDPNIVPRRIRRQAYRMFYNDRLRLKGDHHE